jgi:carboxypeptidase PM20D1
VADHLAQALKFKTVSHEDSKEDDTTQLDGLREFLEKTFPKTHATLAREIVGGHALLYTWKGSSEGLLKPALLAAHMDVVPVDPGTAGTWTHPPFDGVVAEGFVWGRGAVDDKASVIGILEAIEALLATGFQPQRTMYFAFGFDEEVGGVAGARAIADTLASRGVHLEYALDEGAGVTEGIVPDVGSPVAMIGLTEKGYLTVELEVDAPTGHSSMPPPQTAVGVLAQAIDRLEKKQMPMRLAGAARRQLEILAPSMPFLPRVAIANLWLTEPLVVRMLASQPAGNAIVRTTTAPTMIEAGVKDNVLPAKARAIVNFRILPGDTNEGVMAHVREVVADGRVHLSRVERMVSDPPPEAPMDARPYRLLVTTIRQFFPDALITPTLVVGATDGRYYARVADGVYHFGPLVLRKEDLARIHGIDERIGVAGLGTLVRAYEQILRDGS